jgi:hypothetical protein
MTQRPSPELRRIVAERARFCCEYCLYPESLGAAAYQVDHIIAEKHGGQTRLENLAFACTPCNRRKGSDISSLDPLTGSLVALFNPRMQAWPEHFELRQETMAGLTSEGRTTIQFLHLNSPHRINERIVLLQAGIRLVDREIRKPR